MGSTMAPTLSKPAPTVWFWVKRNEPPYQYHCSYADLAREQAATDADGWDLAARGRPVGGASADTKQLAGVLDADGWRQDLDSGAHDSLLCAAGLPHAGSCKSPSRVVTSAGTECARAASRSPSVRSCKRASAQIALCPSREPRPMRAALAAVCRRARALMPLDIAATRAFFEDNFRPLVVQVPAKFTGYFEPELQVDIQLLGQLAVRFVGKSRPAIVRQIHER
jgi:hypothetical protein